MHANLETPFARLHWTSQDIADAVPLRLHELDLFAADAREDSANTAQFQHTPRLRNAYLEAAALPARFGIR